MAVFLFAACDPSPVNADPKEKFHVYLAFGQSNMEGQAWNAAGGTINYNGRVPDEYKLGIPENFVVMASANTANAQGRTKGEWNHAVPPLCRSSNGLGPADYFGRTLIEKMNDPEIKVGVIVVAIAGCGMDMFGKDSEAVKNYIDKQQSWMKDIAAQYGNYPYGRLLDLAKAAQETGVIKGILMHQGETDATNTAWAPKVKAVYDNLLSDLGLEPNSIPLLAGETYVSGQNTNTQNTIIRKLPETILNAHVISSESCTSGGDSLHFSYEGYKLLGQRYGEKMFELLSAR